MNQKELIDLMSARCGQPSGQIRVFLRELGEITQETVAKGESVRIPGIATVQPVFRAARVARNPHTGEPVHVISRWRVRIKPLKALQEAAARRRT